MVYYIADCLLNVGGICDNILDLSLGGWHVSDVTGIGNSRDCLCQLTKLYQISGNSINYADGPTRGLISTWSLYFSLLIVGR